MNEERYLTFALCKGRLASETLALLEKIGITCREMKEKDSRKLIFVNDELRFRFFLAKGPDVPTYVEYGAADIGVVGRDTILEENREVYEVLDLGFGKCRMCVCGPEPARELLLHHERIRVASKYPNIAKDFFYNKKHQTVDIIKLNGSVELGPLVELSDVIVDIVETGSTLRENGLEVLEEVCPLSARMIVNPVSMQMESERIKGLVTKIREKLEEEAAGQGKTIETAQRKEKKLRRQGAGDKGAKTSCSETSLYERPGCQKTGDNKYKKPERRKKSTETRIR